MAGTAPDTQHFDRSVFAMELDALELTETIRSLERLAASDSIKPATKVSIKFAVDALRSELG